MAMVDTADDSAGEGYFASASDLMVGILFVFLLMLTVFALNFRDAEDDQKVERKKYQLALEQVELEKTRAELAEGQAKIAAARAAVQSVENERLRHLLESAVARLQQDIQDRAEARNRLLTSMQQSLAARGVKVSIEPTSGVLRLSEDLLFDLGEASIRKDRFTTITALADVLSQVLPCFGQGGDRTGCDAHTLPILETVLVEGHTIAKDFGDGR